MWHIIQKIYVGQNQVRPSWWGGWPWTTWDFTDWTWDSTKLSSVFTSSSGTYSIQTDWLTTSSANSMIWHLATNNGSTFHKETMELEVYVPSWWFAIEGIVTSVFSSTDSTMGKNWVSMRTQDYSSSSSRPKTMQRLASMDSGNLVNVQQYMWNQWFTLKMEYDWSDWAYSFKLNDTVLWSWTDSSYSSVAAKFTWDIYIVLELNQGSGANKVFIKKATWTLE